MNRFNLMAKLANYMKNSNRKSLYKLDPLTRKELKSLRLPRFKPAFSCGFRGFPKTEKRPGSIKAPTIDQVRARERKYGFKIHVKNGLMFFADNGTMWAPELAQKRLREANTS